MNTLNKFTIIVKTNLPSFFITFFFLYIVLANPLKAQENTSLTGIPLKEKYAFIAWEMDIKGMLGHEHINNPDYIDFVAMLLRDIFPDKREGLIALLNNNDNEFGKKMFADSITSLVQLLKPVPFGKHYVVNCEAILSDYDFNARKFQVFPDTDKYFYGRNNHLFRERVSGATERYKPAESIPVPFGFTDPRIPSYDDKFSMWSKGWNYINLPADSAQKILEKVILNNPDKKRRIFASIEFSPVVYNNRFIATDVLSISYYTNADLTDLIASYPFAKNSELTKDATTDVKVPATLTFAELPFLRNLDPVNDKVRFVVYEGTIVSENELLNGKTCYHSVILQKFEEIDQNNYVQLLALNNDNYNSGKIPTSKYWVQIGSGNSTIWVEGFKGFTILDGAFGKKIGIGSEILVQAPRFMNKFTFSIIGIDRYKYSGTIDKLMIIYDRKGNEVATCELKPVSGDLSIKPINVNLMFKN